MSRTTKKGLDYFPFWRPQNSNASRFGCSIFKTRYKAIRNSSSGFIKRPDVRKFVFERDNYQCVWCGSKYDLTVDHINSVYRAATGEFDVHILNEKENLQTLCNSCNSKKNP